MQLHTQMLKQAEFIDKSNGKPSWTHTELLPHLHRHAAEALQYPRPANVTALFASVDENPEQVGLIARGNLSRNWLRNACHSAVCPNGYAHPPSEQGDISKLPQCEKFIAGNCNRHTVDSSTANKRPQPLLLFQPATRLVVRMARLTQERQG